MYRLLVQAATIPVSCLFSVGGRNYPSVGLNFFGFLRVKVSIACLCLSIAFLSLCFPYLFGEGRQWTLGRRGSWVPEPLSFINLGSLGLIKIVVQLWVLFSSVNGREEEEVAEKEGVS